jgi:hypothetical protein
VILAWHNSACLGRVPRARIPQVLTEWSARLGAASRRAGGAGAGARQHAGAAPTAGQAAAAPGPESGAGAAPDAAEHPRLEIFGNGSTGGVIRLALLHSGAAERALSTLGLHPDPADLAVTGLRLTVPATADRAQLVIDCATHRSAWGAARRALLDGISTLKREQLDLNALTAALDPARTTGCAENWGVGRIGRPNTRVAPLSRLLRLPSLTKDGAEPCVIGRMLDGTRSATAVLSGPDVEALGVRPTARMHALTERIADLLSELVAAAQVRPARRARGTAARRRPDRGASSYWVIPRRGDRWGRRPR